MWHKEYRDYKIDEGNNKCRVEPGKGIFGCEMHEIHGWGNTLHIPKKKNPGKLASLIKSIFGVKNK